MSLSSDQEVGTHMRVFVTGALDEIEDGAYFKGQK
jgi:hypothetical protein